VADEAGLLTEDEELALDRLVRRVWAEEGVRLAVLTVDALDGEPRSAAVRALNRSSSAPPEPHCPRRPDARSLPL